MLSDFAENHTPILTFHPSSTNLSNQVAQISTSCGAFQPQSIIFVIRTHHNSVTSELATYCPKVELWVLATNQSRLTLLTWDKEQSNNPLLISSSDHYWSYCICRLHFPVETISLEDAAIHWTGIWSIEDRGSFLLLTA